MNEEHDEIKRIQQQSLREKRASVRRLLDANGGMYIMENGQQKFVEEIKVFKENLSMWNENTGMAISWNLYTVNTMIFMLSQVTMLHKDAVFLDKHRKLYTLLCAIRKQMVEENEEIIAKSRPDLSTP